MHYPLKVLNIKRETPKAISIEFETPNDLKEIFNFKAGQFLNVQTEINGEKTTRSYSICSSPSSGKLVISVKAIPNGIMSNYLNENLKIGDILHASKPTGKFTISPSSINSKYAFFACGSGITPIISMIKTILESESQAQVFLFYGNKNKEHTIFYDELEDLIHKHTNLVVKYFFSQADTSNEVLNGRITSTKLKELHKTIVDLTSIGSFYFCGPEDMIHELTQTLETEFNINKDQLHFELFFASKKNKPDENNKENQLTISYNNKIYEIEISDDETILDAALNTDLDLPYSCMAGTCGTCECKIHEGEFEMMNNLYLSEDEIHEGKLLACQAILKSKSGKVYFT